MNKPFHELADRLETIYRGEPWFGDSIQTKLKDVTESKAFQQPKEGRHCMAEILSHMEFWRRAFIGRIKGDTSVIFSGESPDNWRDIDVLKKIGWKDLLSSFETTHEALITALRSADSLDQALVADLFGLVEHDVYHLGQLGIVKRLVE